VKCNFRFFHNRSTFYNQLIVRGILRNYNPWIHHGECEDQINNSDHVNEEESLNATDNFDL